MIVPQTNPPDMSKIPGGKVIDRFNHYLSAASNTRCVDIVPSLSVFKLVGALDEISCARINHFAKQGTFAPVTVQGLQDVKDDNIGSYRFTMWNPVLAQKLESCFRRAALNNDKRLGSADFFDYGGITANDQFPSDWWNKDLSEKSPSNIFRKWTYEGVSPMLRYMRYPKGGKHACHYDAGYIYPDGRHRTLFSFVLYLSTNKTGATRIIYDGQENLPVWERNHADWDREVTSDEVIHESYPQKGSVLFFPHRVPHDVQEYDGAEGDRIIIRGDLIFKRA